MRAARNAGASSLRRRRFSLPPRYVAAGAGAAVALAQAAADVVLRGRLEPLYFDAADYHHLAVGVAEHGTYGPPVANRPPVWPLLLAAAYRITGAHPAVGLALNVALAGVAAALTVLLAVRLGLALPAAAVAGLAAGLCPWFLVLGATLYTETAYTAVVVALALLVVTASDRRRRAAWWAGIGIVTGIGLLLRPQLVLWVPLALGLAYAGRRPLPALAFTGAVLVVLTPWTVRNYARLGAFVPFDTRGGVTLASANNDLSEGGQSTAGLPRFPAGTEVQNDEMFRSAAVHWILADPARFVARVPARIVRTFDPTTRLTHGVFGSAALRWAVRGLWTALMVFVIWGLVLHHRGAWLVPVSFLAATLALVAVFGGGFRFLLPVVPFLSIWGVAAAAQVGGRT